MGHAAEHYAAPARAARAARADGYARRRPELTTLHRTLSAHWPAFVEQAEEAGGLPSFVVREVHDYLRCGLPEHGCALLVCLDCGRGVLVAFSCKHRGFCPSCCGRRMSDASLHLTERVLTEVPLRHWVCSLPFQLRHLLGYDRALCADVVSAFVKELSRSYRRRAKEVHGLSSIALAQTGAVTVVQRTDSALRLSVHFHTIAIDGVLAPNAKLRSLVVPRPPAVPTEPVQLPLFTNEVPPQPAPPAERAPRPPPYKVRHPWAQLMRHVFAIDVTTCVHCQGRMRLRELCTTPSAIAGAMAHAGLAPQPPPSAARPLRAHPSQLRLALD